MALKRLQTGSSIGLWMKATPLDHLRLQKLVYIAHGWWLASKNENDRPLINEESSSLAGLGQSFSSLYHALKGFHGSSKITEHCRASL